MKESILSNIYSSKSIIEEILYKIGTTINFPLIANYSAAEQQGSGAEEKESSSAVEQQSSCAEAYSPFTLHASPFTNNYFYFLNGHGDVTYFADQNFTPDQIESYEYSPFGLIFDNISRNNFNFRSLYFDNDIGIYHLNDYIYLSKIAYFLKINRANLNLNKKFFSEIYFKKPFIAVQGLLMPPSIGPTKNCVIGIGCPGGGGVVLGCFAGPRCTCECYSGDYCVYTYKECPFHGYVTIKCCPA